MANLRSYGPPESRVQQTQFWARYFPEQQRANAEFDMRVWAAAKDDQYRQNQADAAADQQDFANRVNLSRFSIGLDDSAQRLAEDRRRFDVNTGLAEKQLEVYGDDRTEARNARSAERAERSFAALQSNIAGRKVRTIDEAWAYVEKTPENVERVSKLLQTVNDEIVKEQVDGLNAETVRRKADKLAAALKLNPQLDSQNKRRALNLDPMEVELIPKMFGQVDPRIRWDSGKDEWTIAPVPAMSRSSTPAAAYSQNVGGADLSRFAPAPSPAAILQQVGNQGGGYFPPAVPRVNLSQFGTATNAPVVAPPPAARRYPPSFYVLVNRLIELGLDPRAAKARAIQEYSQ